MISNNKAAQQMACKIERLEPVTFDEALKNTKINSLMKSRYGFCCFSKSLLMEIFDSPLRAEKRYYLNGLFPELVETFLLVSIQRNTAIYHSPCLGPLGSIQ